MHVHAHIQEQVFWPSGKKNDTQPIGDRAAPCHQYIVVLFIWAMVHILYHSWKTGDWALHQYKQYNDNKSL